jgi:hypothetical protein
LAANLQPESQKLPWRFQATSRERDFFTGRSEDQKVRLLAAPFGAQRSTRPRRRQRTPPPVLAFCPSDLPVKISEGLATSSLHDSSSKRSLNVSG